MATLKIPQNNNFTVLIAGLPAIIAAAVLAFQAYGNSVKADAKAEVIIKKTDEIHTLTNANLSRISGELSVANQKILGLERLVMELMNSKTIGEVVATPPSGKKK